MQKISLFLLLNILIPGIYAIEPQKLVESTAFTVKTASELAAEHIEAQLSEISQVDRKLITLLLLTQDSKPMFIVDNPNGKDEYAKFIKEFSCPLAKILVQDPKLNIYARIIEEQLFNPDKTFYGYSICDLLSELQSSLDEDNIVLRELDDLHKIIIQKAKSTPFDLKNYNLLDVYTCLKSYDFLFHKYQKEFLLFTAAKKGHIEIVKLLCHQISDLNIQDEYRLTPLMYASRNGHLNVVKLLLEKKADVCQYTRYAVNALMLASYGNHIEIVKLLIENGAELDRQDFFGDTVLKSVCARNYIEIVKLLLENGANVNKKDKKGETALTKALKQGHKDIVRLLKSNNAHYGLCTMLFGCCK